MRRCGSRARPRLPRGSLGALGRAKIGEPIPDGSTPDRFPDPSPTGVQQRSRLPDPASEYAEPGSAKVEVWNRWKPGDAGATDVP